MSVKGQHWKRNCIKQGPHSKSCKLKGCLQWRSNCKGWSRTVAGGEGLLARMIRANVVWNERRRRWSISLWQINRSFKCLSTNPRPTPALTLTSYHQRRHIQKFTQKYFGSSKVLLPVHGSQDNRPRKGTSGGIARRTYLFLLYWHALLILWL